MLFQQAISAPSHLLGGAVTGVAQRPDSNGAEMKQIVILGGSFAGVSIAHRILKQAKNKAFKITLVSPNTHFYWNIASVRAMIQGEFTDDEMFQPIASGFAQYPAGQFEFITGTAEDVDVDAKTVEISRPHDKISLQYDMLILATGSRTKEPLPLKGVGSTEETMAALHDLQARVKKAKTIVIAGAGPTGVEVAGEISFAYKGAKEVTLVASGPTVLHETPESVWKIVTKGLHDLGVNVKPQTKVLDVQNLANGGHELTLSDGSHLKADLYLPTHGLVANSSYLSEKFVNAYGFVKVDEYLRIPGTSNIWAAGDVCEVGASQFLSCDQQSSYVAGAIVSILSNKVPRRFKGMTTSKRIYLRAGQGHR
ncbi:hypothetical protein PV10_00328 [Exophiala mesophila]|uniref:FAD/NAD(P)-binding domain-containing protein n=1 Tax=Exophiala mesophila TaxID=212818 RepID=A0A0D2AC17_EXOME|nr:uncharacterized protein PV10_00328 [Exophiala mesophila]KIV96458.1 hypothetical protein PV10_00328 [Exophiala mesophila]